MIKVLVGLWIIVIVACIYAIIVRSADINREQNDAEQAEYLANWKENHPNVK